MPWRQSTAVWLIELRMLNPEEPVQKFSTCMLVWVMPALRFECLKDVCRKLPSNTIACHDSSMVSLFWTLASSFGFEPNKVPLAQQNNILWLWLNAPSKQIYDLLLAAPFEIIQIVSNAQGYSKTFRFDVVNLNQWIKHIVSAMKYQICTCKYTHIQCSAHIQYSAHIYEYNA